MHEAEEDLKPAADGRPARPPRRPVPGLFGPFPSRPAAAKPSVAASPSPKPLPTPRQADDAEMLGELEKHPVPVLISRRSRTAAEIRRHEATVSQCRKMRGMALVAFFRSHPDSLARPRAIRNGSGAFADRVDAEFGYRPSAEECNALSLVAPGSPDRLKAARTKIDRTAKQRMDDKKKAQDREARAARKAASDEDIVYRKLAESTVAAADPAAIAALAARNARFAAEIGIVASVEAGGAATDGATAVGWLEAGRTLSVRLKREVGAEYLRATEKVRKSRATGSAAPFGRRRSMLAIEAERTQLLEEEEASAASIRIEERRTELAAKEAVRSARRPELLQMALKAHAEGARALVDLIAGNRDVRALLEPGQGVRLVLTAEEAALLAAGDEQRRKRTKRRSGGGKR